MLPVSLDVALLKLKLPELILRPGMSVVARVASRGEGGSASIVLAGTLLKASVPEEVAAGETLRLTVAETTPERITLKLEAAEITAGQPLAAPPLEPRAVDPDGEGSQGRRRDADQQAVSLVYETPGLGRLDLRVERGPEGIIVSLGASPLGYPLAQAGAESLRRSLEERTGVPAVVRVNPRRQPFDAYA